MIDEKAVLNLVELAQQSVGYVKFLTEERDVALRECSKWAREAGEATGKLQMSEAAGIVDEWRERAEAAELARDQALERLSETARDALSAELARDRAIREAAGLRHAFKIIGTAKFPRDEYMDWVQKIARHALNPKPEGQGE